MRRRYSNGSSVSGDDRVPDAASCRLRLDFRGAILLEPSDVRPDHEEHRLSRAAAARDSRRGRRCGWRDRAAGRRGRCASARSRFAASVAAGASRSSSARDCSPHGTCAISGRRRGAVRRIVVPSSAGEKRSVSPSVMEETVKLEAGGGGGGVGCEGASEPQPPQTSAIASSSAVSRRDLSARRERNARIRRSAPGSGLPFGPRPSPAAAGRPRTVPVRSTLR